MMNELKMDLRFALRTFAKTPGFTIVVVLTLALGIGANAAIFSLMDQLMLRLLPVKDAQRLVILDGPGAFSGSTHDHSDTLTPLSHPMFEAIRDKNTVFDDVFAHYTAGLHVTAGKQTDNVQGDLVSGTFFNVLGLAPAAGRLFTPADDRTPGGHPIVVLGHGFWTRRFGADPGVVGQSMTVNGVPMTVVGVAPRGFHGVEIGESVDVMRLVRQLLTESLLLSIAGGLLGIVCAAWVGELLVGALPLENARDVLSADPDMRVAAFALALSLITGVVFGLVPALQSARAELAPTLKNEAGAVIGGTTSFRLRKGLVVAQVALSLFLLIGSGLFTRSLINLRNLNPGFQADRLLAFSVDPALNGYDLQRRFTLLKRIQDDLAAEPGVKSASMADVALMTNSNSSSTVKVEGYDLLASAW